MVEVRLGGGRSGLPYHPFYSCSGPDTMEINDGVVELVCRADPGGSEVELRFRIVNCRLLLATHMYMYVCATNVGTNKL